MIDERGKLQKRFFSVREAAQYSSLSARLIYEIVGRKELRHYRIRKRIVIDSQDLETYIKQNCVESRDFDEEARRLMDG